MSLTLSPPDPTKPGFSTCKSVEAYHHATNRWEKVSLAVLVGELSGAALSVVSDLPSVVHCTYYGQCALAAVTDNNCYSRQVPVLTDKDRTPNRIAHLLLRRSAKMRKQLDNHNKPPGPQPQPPLTSTDPQLLGGMFT